MKILVSEWFSQNYHSYPDVNAYLIISLGCECNNYKSVERQDQAKYTCLLAIKNVWCNMLDTDKIGIRLIQRNNISRKY